jgi:hypothetical protein
MEADDSCLQEPKTGPYLEPEAFSPHFAMLFPKIHSNIIFPSTLRSSKWFFLSGFTTKSEALCGIW